MSENEWQMILPKEVEKDPVTRRFFLAGFPSNKAKQAGELTRQLAKDIRWDPEYLADYIILLNQGNSLKLANT